MEGQLLAECTDYPSLIAAFRARALERRIAIGSEAAAEIAGLPDRYLPKILGPTPIRRLGLNSLGPVLGLLGVKLALIEDADAIARFADRVPRMKEKDVRVAAVTQITSKKFLSRIGRLGAAETNRLIAEKKRKRARWRINSRAYNARKKAIEKAPPPYAIAAE